MYHIFFKFLFRKRYVDTYISAYVTNMQHKIKKRLTQSAAENDSVIVKHKFRCTFYAA